MYSPSFEDQARTGLIAASRLRAYRDFLADARAAKPQNKDPSRRDAHVLEAARRALDDAKTVAASAMQIVSEISADGGLDGLLDGHRRSLAARGPTTMVALWTQATGSPENRDALRTAGFDDDLFAACDHALKTNDFEISTDEAHLIVSGTIAGENVQDYLKTAPRPLLPTSADDLLARGRLDALSKALEQGEPAYLAGMPLVGSEMHADELTLCAALACHAEVVAHVRKLEDIGLELYSGGDLVTLSILTYVCLGLMFAAVVMHSIFCPPGDSISSGNFEEPPLCQISKLLWVLSFTGFLFSLVGPKKPGAPSTVAMGSVLVHGTLRDYEVAAGVARA